MSTEDLDVLSKMIGFMYASDYKVPKDFSAILMHTTIYALSIRFEMPALQTLAKTRFEEELSSFGRKLEQINLVELIPEIYESTVESDQGLREPLVRCVGDNIQEFLGTPKFGDAHKANAEFAFDLLRYQAKNGIVPPSQASRCRVCVAAGSKMAAEGNRVSYDELLLDHLNDSKEFQQHMTRSRPPTVAFLEHLRKITNIVCG